MKKEFKIYFKLNLVKQAGCGLSIRSVYGDCSITTEEETTIEIISTHSGLNDVCVSCIVDDKSLKKGEKVLSCDIIKIE